MPGVAGQWFAEITIGGKQMPVAPGLVDEITVRAGIHRNLPTYTLVLRDRGAHALLSGGLDDGSVIDISLGDGAGGPSFSGSFRAIGKPKGSLIPEGFHLTSSGVLDKVPWMRKVSKTFFEGTSSQVIAKLAGEAGLGFKGDPTKDKMVWLPNRQPLASYARFVEDRGWASPSSCMILGCTAAGTVRYRDVDRIIKEGFGKKFTYGGADGKKVIQVEFADKSGITNNSAAYGSTSIGDDVDGTVKKFKDVTAKFMGEKLSFSKFMQDAVGEFGGRINVNPVNAGNVHKKYFEAIHQNERIKATYGNDIHITTPFASGVELLDGVQFDCHNPMDGSIMGIVSGNYMVTGQVFTVKLAGKQQRYFEKLTLTNQG